MSNDNIDTWYSSWLDDIALVASTAPDASIEDLLGQQDERASGPEEDPTPTTLAHASQHPARDVGILDSAETTPALTASLSLGSRSRSSSLHTPAVLATDTSDNSAGQLELFDFGLLFGAEQNGTESEHDGEAHPKPQERAVLPTLPQQSMSPPTAPQMLHKRGRNSEDDSDNELLCREARPIVKKRRQAHPANRTREAAPEESVEATARSAAPAAWQGPDATEASTSSGASAQTSSAVAVSSALAPQGKPLEMCGAIRVIQQFSKSGHWKNGIDLAVQAINALPRNAPPSSLPARKVLTDTDKTLLRSLGPKIPGRRASLADPRYVECTACATDYGIASEPILRSRTKAHNTEYHQGRACSACGLPINGRDTDKARVHRMSCAVWHALVGKGFHKAWLRKNGFYTDDRLKREFWDGKQRKAAKALAGGNTELEIQALEQSLQNVEVAGLELQLRDTSNEPSLSSVEAGPQNEQQRLELASTANVPPPVMYQERWMPWTPFEAWGPATTTAPTGASNHNTLHDRGHDGAVDTPVIHQEGDMPPDALVPGALGAAVEPSAAFATAQDVDNSLDHGALVDAYNYDIGLHIDSGAVPSPSDLNAASGGASGVDEGEPRSIPGDTVDVAGANSVAATLPFPPAADVADTNAAFYGDFSELDCYDGSLYELFNIA